ncbi:hypothetical protein Rhal01_02103 [Rubritalea halochordaticola]|uniref:DUF1294 domain-containing protein n=1 Tax=Rubritalea halochordaticola TaxID=714537 RepID=A0ABP9V5L9_9BACT
MNTLERSESQQHKARIIEWNPQKGYGFLKHGKKRVFLHRRDFSEHHKRPAPGDHIHFTYGVDASGRQCAVNARHVNDGGKLTLGSLVLVLLLLLIPSLALYKLTRVLELSLYLLPAVFLAINLITFSLYSSDKSNARKKLQRIPESMLHFWEFIGGWAGALLAQKKYRHKATKSSYQFSYWAIVILHLFVCTDYLLRWRMSLFVFESLRDL